MFCDGTYVEFFLVLRSAVLDAFYLFFMFFLVYLDDGFPSPTPLFLRLLRRDVCGVIQ